MQHPASAHPSSRFRWLLTRASDDLSSGDEAAAVVVAHDSAEPELDEERGASVTVKLTAPAPARYILRVQLLSHVTGGPDAVLAETSLVASYRYVRRELRDLTEADSTAFFEALQTFYTVTLEEGKARYGQTFGNAKIMSAYHHSTVKRRRPPPSPHSSEKFCLLVGFISCLLFANVIAVNFVCVACSSATPTAGIMWHIFSSFVSVVVRMLHRRVDLYLCLHQFQVLTC